jgi:5-methylcytosine-specific restriction endonuclease McrA
MYYNFGRVRALETKTALIVVRTYPTPAKQGVEVSCTAAISEAKPSKDPRPVPNGDPAAIFDRALTLLVADLERRKPGCVARPRQTSAAKAGSRHVPAAVRREVWSRDGGRCAFVGARGRCTEQGFLEFHHVVPFARGGPTNTENLQLRCRAHNAYQAERDFGPWFVREPHAAYELVPERVSSSSGNRETKSTALIVLLSEFDSRLYLGEGLIQTPPAARRAFRVRSFFTGQ